MLHDTWVTQTDTQNRFTPDQVHMKTFVALLTGAI